ncbi:MAG: hypothetical protein DWQ45_15030 [Planctomycetota bacterium]|nr:MAG: hypothetical protein DWQ41_10760 [Planctomycetota bacterium]REK33498.1 MAG: hypothetical protein DWQ45_15030 [Planctomycetota bacterium]
MQAESESILGLDERLNKSREAVEQIKREGEIELGNALVEKAVNDAEEEIVDRRAKLEERLTAFEERLRDFNSKRTKLGYGGTYEPDVVSLREQAGIAVAKGSDAERQSQSQAEQERTLARDQLVGSKWHWDNRMWFVVEFKADGIAQFYVHGKPAKQHPWSMEGDTVRIVDMDPETYFVHWFRYEGQLVGDRILGAQWWFSDARTGKTNPRKSTENLTRIE